MSKKNTKNIYNSILQCLSYFGPAVPLIIQYRLELRAEFYSEDEILAACNLMAELGQISRGSPKGYFKVLNHE